jgi:hypothetical protein
MTSLRRALAICAIGSAIVLGSARCYAALGGRRWTGPGKLPPIGFLSFDIRDGAKSDIGREESGGIAGYNRLADHPRQWRARIRGRSRSSSADYFAAPIAEQVSFPRTRWTRAQNGERQWKAIGRTQDRSWGCSLGSG